MNRPCLVYCFVSYSNLKILKSQKTAICTSFLSRLSHSSFPALIPSPHEVIQIEGSPWQVHPSSYLHYELHPSELLVFLSSQASVVLMSPSPQKGEQIEGSEVQVKPISKRQVEEQPSPEIVSPSSQFSVPLMIPSPQSIIQLEGNSEHTHPTSV